MYAAAMALSGYPSHYYTDSANVKVPVTPNLKLIMNDTNAQLMNNFMNQLFHVREDSFKVGKKLRPLLECMFSSILMYHSRLLTKFGQTHIITSSLIRSGREFAVSEKMLCEWGECIRVDWDLRNSKLQSNSDENRVLMESIIKNNAELQLSNNQQMKEIKSMRQDMKMLRSTIENFEGLFKDIRQHLSGTPSKKRKVEEVILTELIVSF
jgi:hypothetical protein